MKFPKEVLLGASTAAHQVEGNNRYSDLWAQEQMEHSSFAEPSNDAVDHYHRYEEDIALMAGAECLPFFYRVGTCGAAGGLL